MTAVVARFFVAETKRFAYQPGNLHVTMRPVSRGPENKVWAAATPSGEFTMQISNESAAEWFAGRLGREVAITIEDRPLMCAECKREIDDLTSGYHASESMSLGADELGHKQGDVLHTTCLERLREASTD